MTPIVVRPTHPLPAMPVGADYRVVNRDACHFFITPSRFDGPVFRVPLRNVYVVGQRYAGQETTDQIIEGLSL